MTHFKLGLFALATVLAGIAALVALGLHRETSSVRFHTYFDESVQGLDLGSPVDYRGVEVGTVGSIGVAPDGRLIDVALDIRKAEAVHLGYPQLRSQLSNQGITGLKFVDIDWAADSTPPVLAFVPPTHYIPSRLSLLVNLSTLAPKLTRLVDSSTATVERLGRVLDHADNAIVKIHGIEDLIARAKHAVDAFGELGRSATGSSSELEHTLRDIGDAARSFHDLVEDVERDPDMLVKGRSRS